uniref:Globin family profile domain-containing protein n=1 Tax=Panagrolaimus sp. JU765 TaxID=591449 RepID=A0AC34Q7H2_9BILA
MMRIKEAIQRRKLIQQLNDEYGEDQHFTPNLHPQTFKLPSISDNSSGDGSDLILSGDEQRVARLRDFVKELNSRLTYPQQRALKVTWKRLSEAPKTSGRGNLQIMEKIFDRLIEQEPSIMSVFYRSAFIKCIEDRRNKCHGKSIATLRDHAHLLIDFIDGILCIMFDQPLTKTVYDPVSIGQFHAKLNPLGFDRHIWLKLGECFAEVMFSQEVVRAYPHAASAWSLLAVACTDKMFINGKIRPTEQRHSSASLNFSMNSDSISYRSLDQMDIDSDSCPTAPPNTERNSLLNLSSESSSQQNSSLTTSTCPFSNVLLKSPKIKPKLETIHSVPDLLLNQRNSRQLPLNTVCGKYAAKKDAFRTKTRLKTSSFSNLS